MRNKLGNLQTLRGIAALMVAIFHSHFLVTIPEATKIISSVRGSIGVPLFFILSGFIMVYTNQTDYISKKKEVYNFFIKRIVRIVPLYYFSILVWVFITRNNIEVYFGENLHILLKTIFFTPQFTSKVAPDFGFPINYVGWTLNYEMFFYLLFGLSLTLGKYRYWAVVSFFTLAIFILPLAVVGNFSFSLNTFYNFKYQYFNFFSNTINLFFVSGVLIGIYFKKQHIKSNSIELLGRIIAIGLFILLYIGVFKYNTLLDLAICSAFVFFIVNLDFITSNSFKPLVYLGDISYSLYVIHPLVYLYLPNFAQKIGWSGLLSSWYFVIIGILTAILASIVTYEIIEKRFTKYLRSKLLINTK